MVEDLLQALYDYKCIMEYNNSDFNADRTKQYESVRVRLASNEYEVENGLPFGLVDVTPMTEDENRQEYLSRSVEEKKQIRKGYNRVQEKIKELRQNFSQAVTAGTRSGSGKLVMQFYDLMVQIWGGAPATEPLSFGIQSHNAADEHNDDNTYEGSNEEGEIQGTFNVSEDSPNSSVIDTSARKRPVPHSMAPVLIDNKRKHMERQLSAGQRDKLLMEEGKEERKFRKELSKSIQESNALFADSLKAMSSSMVALASSMQKSVDFMAQSMAFSQQQQQPYAPNVVQHGNYINHQDMGVYTKMLANLG
eukprot:Seg129.7 transcript_id=Seg129.7/GoldUCD/mRNA.D3Y31 product="hypothetical protein" protein_id=Seg129.7/GoldUCD/D3Y31